MGKRFLKEPVEYERRVQRVFPKYIFGPSGDERNNFVPVSSGAVMQSYEVIGDLSNNIEALLWVVRFCFFTYRERSSDNGKRCPLRSDVH